MLVSCNVMTCRRRAVLATRGATGTWWGHRWQSCARTRREQRPANSPGKTTASSRWKLQSIKRELLSSNFPTQTWTTCRLRSPQFHYNSWSIFRLSDSVKSPNLLDYLRPARDEAVDETHPEGRAADCLHQPQGESQAEDCFTYNERWMFRKIYKKRLWEEIFLNPSTSSVWENSSIKNR